MPSRTAIILQQHLTVQVFTYALQLWSCCIDAAKTLSRSRRKTTTFRKEAQGLSSVSSRLPSTSYFHWGASPTSSIFDQGNFGIRICRPPFNPALHSQEVELPLSAATCSQQKQQIHQPLSQRRVLLHPQPGTSSSHRKLLLKGSANQHVKPGMHPHSRAFLQTQRNPDSQEILHFFTWFSVLLLKNPIKKTLFPVLFYFSWNNIQLTSSASGGKGCYYTSWEAGIWDTDNPDKTDSAIPAGLKIALEIQGKGKNILKTDSEAMVIRQVYASNHTFVQKLYIEMKALSETFQDTS